jgi:hypothetical protein
VEVADLGVVGGDGEVAGDHQLEPAGGDVALEHRDRRSVHGVEPVAHLGGEDGHLHRGGGPDVVREQLVEVEPGAERAATPAEDQHPQVGVAVDLADDLVEAVQQLHGDGVLLVRPVQPHAGDVAVLLEHDVVRDCHEPGSSPMNELN